MQVLAPLVHYLKNRQGGTVFLEAGQPGFYQAEDGTRQVLSDPLTADQLAAMLNQTIPESNRAAWHKGQPFRFSYVCEQGTLGVNVAWPQGRLRIALALCNTTAAPFVLRMGSVEIAPGLEAALAAAAQTPHEPLTPPSPAAAAASPATPFLQPPPVVPQPVPRSPAPAPMPPAEPPILASVEAPPAIAAPPSAPPPAPRAVVPTSVPAVAAGQFPQRSSWVLALERFAGLLACVLGIALGGIVSATIAWGSNETGMLARMFNRNDPATLIPVAICCMFFWGAFLCVFRLLRLAAVARLSRKSLLLELVRTLSTGTDAAARQLQAMNVAGGPLLRRAQAVLEQWQAAPGIAEADIVLQQHAAHDEEEVHAAYSLVRMFVWALPVLGLIGTVIGISLAVGRFAEFLGTGVDEVSLIKENLVGVTGGLSFAFLITLLGLLTSLLLMFAASILQTREQRLMAAVQQGIADHFLPALQRVAPAGERAEPARATAWQEAIAKAADELLKTVHQTGQEHLAATRSAVVEASQGVLATVCTAAEQWLRDLDARRTEAKADLDEWTRVQRSEATVLGDRIAAAIEQCGATMESTTQWLDGRLTDLRRAMEETAGRLQAAVESQAQATVQPQAELLQAIGEQATLVRANAENLSNLAKTNAAFAQTQQDLQANLRELRSAELGEALRGLTAAMTGQCRDVQNLSEAVERLTGLTEQVAASQAALQTAARDLRESDFSDTLAAFRETLGSVAGVLDGFRRPFVLQAVAVPAIEHGNGNHSHRT